MGYGKVVLIGAGPGDPGLITVKGMDWLNRSDIVVYDHLVDDRLLREIPDSAEKIYVGKVAGCHSMKQEDINRLLIEKAGQGKIVVRLKGGDPFVLGRGGEEAEALAMNNVEFEIVPGITSAIAVPAYAGIPVTHRKMASSFTVVTGHEDPGKDESTISWSDVGAEGGTIVILMAMAKLSPIIDQIIEGGRSSETPIAVIQSGTTAGQKTVTGTLGDIVKRAEQAGITPPAVIVIGDVVNLRDKLAWFDTIPLYGKKVLVTRARHQASRLSNLLAAHGAMPIELPAIEIEPVQDPSNVNDAIQNLNRFNWIIFTSVNGVDAFFKHLEELNLDSRQLACLTIGAIGPATAEALQQKGLRADFVPAAYTSDGLLEEMRNKNLNGQRILLPRVDIAGKDLSSGLEALGAEVRDVVTYHTVTTGADHSNILKMVSDGEIDVVTFTSSSTVSKLIQLMNDDNTAVNKAVVACIGPVTAETAQKLGLRIDILASEHTIPGLVAAINDYYQKGSNR